MNTQEPVLAALPLTMRESPELRRRDLISRTLQMRAGSVNEETRSFEAVLLTENQTAVFDWRRFEVIDEVVLIRGVQPTAQVVLLESHLRESLDFVLGSVREIHSEGGRIVGRCFVADKDERAERAWQKIVQGHITDVSAGYSPIESTEIRPGETKRVAGKEYTAGQRMLRITTKSKLREVSLLAIGADDEAKIREENAGLTGKDGRAGRADMEVHTMNESLREYLESLGLRGESTEEQAWAYLGRLEGEQRSRADGLRAAPDDAGGAGDGQGKNGEDPPPPATPAGQRAEPAAKPKAPVSAAPVEEPAEAPVDADAVRKKAVEAERKRVATVRELAGDDVPAAIAERAITEGWDQARASAEFLQAIRGGRAEPVSSASGGLPAIHSHSHEGSATLRALSAGLVHRAGLNVIEENASEERRRQQERDAEMGDRFRDLSMLDLCREAIRLDGRRAPYGRDETIRAAVSGASLSHIFTTTVGAQLLASYVEAGDTTVGWVRETDVANFQTQERKRLGKTAGLEKLPRGDTAKHATIADTGEEYRVARYAKMFVVDEQDIIDDRFNALLDMPREMGAGAGRLRPDLIYAILLANASLGADSVALFHGDHSNLATAALAAAALEAGIAAMAKQTEDGVNLNIKPRFLLIPQDLFFTAAVLLKSAQRIIASASGGTYNPLLDEQIDIRSDNRLGVAGVTDPATGTVHAGTATNWFLVGAPVNPTIEVGYLRGTARRPMLRSFILDKGQYGIGWDIKMDIGVKALDYRAMYKSTGAA